MIKLLLVFIADETPSEKAVVAVKQLLQSGVSAGFLQPGFDLYGHRDLGNTECPGEKLYAALPRLRSTSWTSQTICQRFEEKLHPFLKLHTDPMTSVCEVSKVLGGRSFLDPTLMLRFLFSSSHYMHIICTLLYFLLSVSRKSLFSQPVRAFFYSRGSRCMGWE